MKLLAVIFAVTTLTSINAFSQSGVFIHEKEKHFKNIRQLTFSGENAEAYLSFDEKSLIFQSHDPLHEGSNASECDQIFTMGIDGKNVKLVSTGKGRTTCSYFLPNGKIIYASTHEGNASCPQKPDMSMGYVWPLYNDYQIYTANADGSDPKVIVSSPSYDAEATVSPKGDRIIFTSTRNGDIDLYTCALDGTDIKQVTNEPGYDGGAFFSQDGKMIVYRASRPAGKELEEYMALLKKGMVRPGKLEIYVANADGSNARKVTDLGKASFAPFFHPDGKRIIFSSNIEDPKGRNFDLYMVNIDGTGLQRITYFDGFDGFPMFTRDGKHIVFCSNRSNAKEGDTNVFVADWVE